MTESEKKYIETSMSNAECRAWAALSEGKYNLFASRATAWTALNKTLTNKKKNPFEGLIQMAKGVRF